MPEVAPGGDGTRFRVKCRVAAEPRRAALPVRRRAGEVGFRAVAADSDAGRLGAVPAAAGPVPGMRADACAAAGGPDGRGGGMARW